MATPYSEAWRCARELETGLRQLLETPDTTYDQIDQGIHCLRLACQDTIVLDMEVAQKDAVGARLWETHGIINKAYRKKLDKLKAMDARQVAVEQRKLTKHYADFLKTSQHFYKGHIQILSHHFGEMPRLSRIAGAMRVDVPPKKDPIYLAPEKHYLLESAVHACLLRLGDLARYRSLLRTKEPGWEVSLGFLNLANDLCPEDPNAHHQMAVVALAKDNHLDALYHFFLALNAIKAPPPAAKKNLAIECKKINGLWKKHQVSVSMNQKEKFVWWFVVLQSAFHRGEEFSAQYELENQVLTDMVPLLKEESFDDTLQRCVVISIAAEATAITQLTEQDDEKKPETVQSFYFSIAFNINMLSVLLQNFVNELPSNSHNDSEEYEDFSAKICRILPALRQYSTWLAQSSETILQFANTSELRETHTRIMWQLYAKALTGIAQSYSISKLTRVAYLLEEDTRTAGFAMFCNSELANFYKSSDGGIKPHFNDTGVIRQSSFLEMESRLFDIIFTAITLVGLSKIPLKLGNFDGHFEFDEEFEMRRALGQEVVVYTSPVQSEEKIRYAQDLARCQHAAEMARRNGVAELASNRNLDCETPIGFGRRMSPPENFAVGPTRSFTHQPEDPDMERMVDDLLGPSLQPDDETSYGMDSRAAEEIFAPVGINGYEHRFQGTPTMMPSFPGLYTNAFTPQANELGSRQLSPLSLSTKEKRLSAAIALDESGSPWAKPNRYTPNPISHSVNQSLQDSLSMQYASSAFSNSSGLFPDATQQRLDGARTFGVGDYARNGNDSTFYPGATDFERNMMLNSSVWNGSQQHLRSMQTPPGGQG